MLRRTGENRLLTLGLLRRYNPHRHYVTCSLTIDCDAHEAARGRRVACKVAAFILDQSPPIGHDTRTGVPGTKAEEARQAWGL